VKYLCPLCLMALLWLAGCGGDNDCSASERGRVVGTISAAQLWSELGAAAKPTIIDVRGKAAYELSHLPSSVNDCGCSASAAAGSASRTAVRRNVVIVGETLEQEVLAGPGVLETGEQARALEDGMAAWPHGLDISASQLTLWLDAGRDMDVIDVRTPSEWQAGHLSASVNHPLADLPVWAEALDPSREIVLICGSGVRSVAARDELMQRGFSRVHNLLGGLATMDQALFR
jgi:phage shock protein E